MRNKLFALVMFFSTVSLTACTQNIQLVDYIQKSKSLSVGMDKNTVLQVLGPHKRIEVREDSERWIYWSQFLYGYKVIDNEQDAPNRFVVTFVNNHLSKWESLSIRDDILEKQIVEEY